MLRINLFKRLWKLDNDRSKISTVKNNHGIIMEEGFLNQFFSLLHQTTNTCHISLTNFTKYIILLDTHSIITPKRKKTPFLSYHKLLQSHPQLFHQEPSSKNQHRSTSKIFPKQTSTHFVSFLPFQKKKKKKKKKKSWLKAKITPIRGVKNAKCIREMLFARKKSHGHLIMGS